MGARYMVGDIFEILLGDKKGYLQYIGNDLTQLNSDVIRVFKRRDLVNTKPDLEEVLNDEVEFYSHVTGVEFGVEDGIWKRIGNSKNVGDLTKPFFRDAADDLEQRENGEYGLPKVSKTWNVWRMNESMKHVEKLENENIKADIGVVTWPKYIVARMRTGKYHSFYPDYK